VQQHPGGEGTQLPVRAHPAADRIAGLEHPYGGAGRGQIGRARQPGQPRPDGREQNAVMASYSLNPEAVAQAERLIDSRQYVLDSDWGAVQPKASEQNAFLERHSFQEYARWHLGLTDGAADQTKARYAFVYGDFRRVHRMGIIACMYRAAEWRHKEIELAAHELLQRLDKLTS